MHCNGAFIWGFSVIFCLVYTVNSNSMRKHYVHGKKKSSGRPSHHGYYHQSKLTKRHNKNLLKKSHNHRYFLRGDEMELYKNRMEIIDQLGRAIHCKIRNCLGDKRYQIPDQVIRISTLKTEEANERQQIPEQMNQLSMQREDMSAGDPSERNIDDVPGNQGNHKELPPQAMFNDNPMHNVEDDIRKFGHQADAARFGQQPQLKLSMPSKELENLQPGEHTEEQFAGPMHDDPGGMDQEALMRMQHQRYDTMMQNSEQNKLGFMDRPFRTKPRHHAGPPTMDLDDGRNDESPMEYAARAPDNRFKDDMESPHGVANNEGNPVSDKDIMKAESIQPNEMHDLHNLLKSSNDVNAKNRHRDFNSESKFMSPEDLSEQGDEREHDRHGNNGPDEDEEQERFGKPQVKINQHASVQNHEMNLHHSNSMFKAGNPQDIPNLANVIDGGSNVPGPMEATDNSPNINYIQQNTRQMLDSNSDYKLPGSSFSNLWKDFMMTTQSQLGEADPSANSREGMLGETKGKARGGRWKKSHVDALIKSPSSQIKMKKSILPAKIRRSSTSLIPELIHAQLVYIPMAVIKSAFFKASKRLPKSKPPAYVAAPEKQMNSANRDKVNQNKNNTLSTRVDKKNRNSTRLPPLFLAEKDGKRYLVFNPESDFVRDFSQDKNRNYDSSMLQRAYSLYNKADSNLNKNDVYVQSKDQQDVNPSQPSQENAKVDTPVQSHFPVPVFNGPLRGSIFKGFVAVPILSKMAAFLKGTSLQPSVTSFSDEQNDRIPEQRSPNDLGNIANYFFHAPEQIQDHSPEPQQSENTFIYGSSSIPQDDAAANGDNIFEKMSMAQPLTSGHFYHDPDYDPHESESLFPDPQPKPNYMHQPRPDFETMANHQFVKPSLITPESHHSLLVNDNGNIIRPPMFKLNSPMYLNRIEFQKVPAIEPTVEASLNLQGLPGPTPARLPQSLFRWFPQVNGPMTNPPTESKEDSFAPIEQPTEAKDESINTQQEPTPPVDFAGQSFLQAPSIPMQIMKPTTQISNSLPSNVPLRGPNEDLPVFLDQAQFLSGNNFQQKLPQPTVPMEGKTDLFEGIAPSPVKFKEARKRSKTFSLNSLNGHSSSEKDEPIVFAKEHIGFGPITVEAKTADSPIDDNGDR